jgi:hypothetical protein
MKRVQGKPYLAVVLVLGFGSFLTGSVWDLRPVFCIPVMD